MIEPYLSLDEHVTTMQQGLAGYRQSLSLQTFPLNSVFDREPKMVDRFGDSRVLHLNHVHAFLIISEQPLSLNVRMGTSNTNIFIYFDL